jgi:hypothetical protein
MCTLSIVRKRGNTFYRYILPVCGWDAAIAYTDLHTFKPQIRVHDAGVTHSVETWRVHQCEGILVYFRNESVREHSNVYEC